MNDINQDVMQHMEETLEHLQKELRSLRTSRANPALLDSVSVEVYGTHLKLKEISNITTPEPRQLLITPFDSNNASTIGKAIENANLSVQPIVDGNIIRINMPPMDESIRKEMVKQCKKKGEEAKISVREVRRKFNDLVRKQKADGELPEDMMKKFEKTIQEKTDKYCKRIDELCQIKDKEILEI